MRRKGYVYLVLAGLTGMLAAGCGGSAAVTGPDEPVVARGSSVLHGAVLAPGISSSSAFSGLSAQSGGSGWVVSVVGTSISSELDQDGRFVLTLVPAGSVTLRIEGPGVSAQVQVSGLVDGQVTSIEIRVSGGSAQLTTTPKCTPSAETFFSGKLERVSGTQLVVAGRSVDASQIQKVWRGARRIQLSNLEVGEKIKVWGLLRGDGVVVADEIQALSSGADKWITFKGRVESVGFTALSVHANPNSPSTGYPTLFVAGYKVKTDGGTKFKWSDGSALDRAQIRAGDQAYVEGWLKEAGFVLAAKVVVDCR